MTNLGTDMSKSYGDYRSINTCNCGWHSAKPVFATAVGIYKHIKGESASVCPRCGDPTQRRVGRVVTETIRTGLFSKTTQTEVEWKETAHG